MFLRYHKNPASFDCDFCMSRNGLKERRNCGWEAPGICKECGEIKFEDVERAPTGNRFICPLCGGRVVFGNASEMLLGRYIVPGCPKQVLSDNAIFMVNLVDWSDKIGVLPSATTLLEESMFYFEARNFILNEYNIAEEEMRPKEK